MREIYADNAATTKLSPVVLEKMMPYFTEVYGNPSSLYGIGQTAKKAVEDARENIAKNLGAKSPSEIYFTSGGSESDNWALKGICNRLKSRGKKHIITSKFEHHAILHTCKALEKDGFEVTYLDVYDDGLVRPEDVENAIREDTAIVSIMYANNEIGTIQPIAEIGAICKAHKVLFHTDAVQAAGYCKIDVQEQNIDLLSMTAHKIHGPKGTGLLYVRKGVLIDNLIEGGAQERNKRAGTENIAGIVGLDAAFQLALDTMDERNAKLEKLRDKLIDGLLEIPRSRVNGDRVHRLPNNVNMCFEGIEGESLLLRLEMAGISASSGSACTSGSLDPSHVLLAIGLPHEIAHGSTRMTFDETTTEEDIDYILETVPKIVKMLRDMSPLWEQIVKGEKSDAKFIG
ncbi:MAG: cysteine desulfurase NifS [Ruminococcus sp.]|nr:cysteine desulfurase NifS [Ruminococcus sp.]